MIKMDTPEDVIRRYWRDNKRTQRASKKTVVLRPHVTEKKQCDICGHYHPSEVITAHGTLIQIDSTVFHADGLGITGRQATPMEKCIGNIMDVWGEDEAAARQTCMKLLNDPFYHHYLPETKQLVTGKPKIDCSEILFKTTPAEKALATFINRGFSPREAWQKAQEQFPEKQAVTVGDLFGKSRAEIAAMTKKKKDPTLTVGDLFGKTKKQILREQRRGWDQEDNEAFEQCVIEKMKEGKTRKEAEDICEALNATSADRGAKKKLPLAEGVAGQIHV